MRLIAFFTTLALCTIVATAPALADQGKDKKASVSFFSGGSASAGWAKTTPPPGDNDRWSIRLFVNGSGPTDYNDFAGADLLNVAGPAPVTAPSFDFKADRTAASGGSPRLVMLFTDGGKMELRPLAWVANLWTHIDGTGPNWDIASPTCPFVYAGTYAMGLACHLGATVTDVFVVSDSGWLNPGGYVNWIDNISYDGAFVTRPGKGHGGNNDDNNGDSGDNDD